MAKKEKGVLHKSFAAAREAVKTGNNDHARDLFDFMIYTLANERWENDVQVDEELEGVRVGVGVTQGFVALTCALPLTSVIVKTFPLPSDFLI